MSTMIGPYWAYSNAQLRDLQWQKYHIGGITDPNRFMHQLHQLLPFPELIADLRPSPRVGYSLYVTTPYSWGIHDAMKVAMVLASMGPTISRQVLFPLKLTQADKEECLVGTYTFFLPVELGPGVFRMTKWVEAGEIITKFEGDLDRAKIIGEPHVLSPAAQAFAPQGVPLPPTPQGYGSQGYPSPQTYNPALDQQRARPYPASGARNPPQGSDSGQGYNANQGSDPRQDYNAAQGHNPSQNYNPNQGYGPQGYGPARGRTPAQAQGYNPAQGYPPAPAQGYPPAQGYSSPRAHSTPQPYNAPQGQNQTQGYLPPRAYTPAHGYNGPLPYLPGRSFSPGPGGTAPPSPLVRDMRPAVSHWLQQI